MNIKNAIMGNKFVQLAYRGKAHIDIGSAVVGWFTTKLPEIMSIVYLTDRIGWGITNEQILFLGLGAIVGLMLFGMFWKNTGLYDTDRYTQTSKDPVANELLTAARITIANEERRKNGIHRIK